MQVIQYKVYALISVSQPVLQQGVNFNASPYVTYLISGKDPHGDFCIRRRFRQFDLLRQKLVERFIGIYIPPLPSKKASGNTEERFVEQRRKFLNYFCLKIVDKPFIFDSDIFQTFIRGDPDFERAARFISGQELALIANIYDVEYREIAEQLNISRIEAQIEAQRKVLQIVEEKLTQVRQQMRKLVDIQKDYISQYSKCFSIVLPRFQQEFLSKHLQGQQPKYIYFNNLPFKERKNEYAHFSSVNPLLDYIQTITYDIRETRALLEAIHTRKTFQNKKVSLQSAYRQSKEELEKLQSGRMSIKSIFTPGNKEVQIKELEDNIPYYQRNEAFLEMCLPFSAVSIHRDIQLFKKSRSVDYLGALEVIAQKEMRILDLHGSMMKTIQVKLISQPLVLPQSPLQQDPPLKEKGQDNS